MRGSLDSLQINETLVVGILRHSFAKRKNGRALRHQVFEHHTAARCAHCQLDGARLLEVLPSEEKMMKKNDGRRLTDGLRAAVRLVCGATYQPGGLYEGLVEASTAITDAVWRYIFFYFVIRATTALYFFLSSVLPWRYILSSVLLRR